MREFKDNTTTVEIPDFDGLENIEIEVRRPQLMAMMSQGKIPNHLLGIASKAIVEGFGIDKEDKIEDKAKEMLKWSAFYCEMCMVQPKYEDVKDYLTDDQIAAIFGWAIMPAHRLRSFRNEAENETNNRDGKTLSKKTK